MNLISEEQTHTRFNTIRLWISSRSFLSAVLCAVIPILFLVSVDQLTKAKGPQWLPYTFENPYHYLFNSLLLVQGKPTPYFMHPGTTTLTFGALILRASSFKSADDLVEYSLRNPEAQIKKLHGALLIFTALILWMAPLATTLALRSYIVGLLIQAPVLFYQSLLYWSIVFGPELMTVGLSVAVICCCVLLLVPSAVSEKRIVCGLVDNSEVPSSLRVVRIPFFTFVTVLVWPFGIITWRILFGVQLMNVGICLVTIIWCLLTFLPVSQRTLVFGLSRPSIRLGPARFLQMPLVPFVTGLLCAFGVATKLVFFPLVLISLFCCRTPKNLATFAAVFVLGLAFALAPIYSQLSGVFGMIFNFGVHSGPYGSGQVGLPGAKVYLQSLEDFFQTEPLLVIITIAATVVTMALSVLGNRRNPREIRWSTILPIFGLQVVSYCIIAKEIYPRYLFPLCLSVGLNLVLLFYTFQTKRFAAIRIAGGLVLIGLLFLGLKDFVVETPGTYQDLRTDRTEQLRLYNHARELTKNDVRVDYFFSDSPQYPLFTANKTAGNAFSSLLTRLYPNPPLFYNYSSGNLEDFTGPLDTDAELQKHDHLYFLGDPDTFPKLKGIEPNTLDTIDTGGSYSLQKWSRK
jgi:hypothetical protein